MDYHLNSVKALSEDQRKAKEDRVATLRDTLKALEAQLTLLVITKVETKTL